MESEPTIPASERTKTFHALDRAATADDGVKHPEFGLRPSPGILAVGT
jgi:hypothetical protein